MAWSVWRCTTHTHACQRAAVSTMHVCVHTPCVVCVVQEYATLRVERAATQDSDTAIVASGWPKQGAVEFVNVRMRYREELDYVLKVWQGRFTARSCACCSATTSH